MRQVSLICQGTISLVCLVAALVGFCLIDAAPAFAQESVPAMMNGLAAGLPALVANDTADGSTSYSLSLQILALMTALNTSLAGGGPHSLRPEDSSTATADQPNVDEVQTSPRVDDGVLRGAIVRKKMKWHHV